MSALNIEIFDGYPHSSTSTAYIIIAESSYTMKMRIFANNQSSLCLDLTALEAF